MWGVDVPQGLGFTLPVSCRVCEGQKGNLVFVGRDLTYGIPGEFPVYRCSHCGAYNLGFAPTEEQIRSYYPSHYAPHAHGDNDAFSWPKRFARWDLDYANYKLARVITRLIREPGKVLDVGCGTGGFLVALKRRGWDVQGVEIVADAARRAQVRGVSVFVGTIEEAMFPSDNFDLVTFWDVLEHTVNPRSVLLEARRIVKRKGWLAVSTPNPESWEARVFGPSWAGWDLPRHLWLPSSARGLAKLLRDTGWNVKQTACLRGRYWLLALSLRRWYCSHPTLLRWLTYRLMSSMPARVILLPYFSVVEFLRRGSIMVLFAQRME